MTAENKIMFNHANATKIVDGTYARISELQTSIDCKFADTDEAINVLNQKSIKLYDQITKLKLEIQDEAQKIQELSVELDRAEHKVTALFILWIISVLVGIAISIYIVNM